MNRRSMMLSAAAAVLTARSATILAQGASVSKALSALFDQFMKENLDHSPITVTSLGLDHGERAHQKGELDDLSEAAIARSKARTASQLSRLQAFDRKSLSAADATSYDVVMYGLRADADANSKFPYGTGGAGLPYVVSQFNGSYQDIPSSSTALIRSRPGRTVRPTSHDWLHLLRSWIRKWRSHGTIRDWVSCRLASPW